MSSSIPVQFSQVTRALTQSGIRSASARCAALNGINLGQGVCDIPTHALIKQAAADAINANKNLYAPHEGVPELKQALAQKITKFNQIELDPTGEIVITHGSTGAYVAAAKSLFNPGDEVILFEPFYTYHKNILELFGVKTVSSLIDLTTFAIDFTHLESLVNKHTRALVLCSPCNPSGKVFSKEELILVGEFAKRHNLWIITDEIYEYITYPGHEHVSIACLNDYWQRTITISGFSKTYNVTGWRLGYAYGPAEVISKMALVHDLFYVCPATPLQHAMIAALQLPDSIYEEMRLAFLKKRDYVIRTLRELGFKLTEPQGAYYLMADLRALNFPNDEEAANTLLEAAKVATVPGRCFYHDPARGSHLLRFCYALDESKLQKAMANLQSFFSSSLSLR